ncbi:hypothetical protein CPB97_011638 [Podila verticillata]|nr:hypothetical protein CPB97_011638 [Podila verticillata]
MSGALASVALNNVQCGLEFWEAMPLCPQLKFLSLPIYARLFKLKHLRIRDLIAQDKDANSTQGRHLLCSPNLESLNYTAVNPRTSEVEVAMMVQDIKEAIVAAAEGRNHYEQDQDTTDENVEQYQGLIPGKKLHTINLPSGGVKDLDLDFLINNTDALRSLSGRITLNDTILESLMLHCNTLVKVDIRCGTYVICQLLDRCPLLQELVVGRM